MDRGEIPQRVGSEAYLSTTCVHAKRPRLSMTLGDPVSKVFDSDDLLTEIMVCLVFPTSLVRAALVCKRWYRHASDPGFLGRFRKFHPPRLLGFYVQAPWWDLKPIHFVPMLPQPPELASVICRRARFNLDTQENERHNLGDCLNGSVTIHLASGSKSTTVVHNPLFPKRCMATVPPFLHHPRRSFRVTEQRRQLVIKEEGVGFSLYYVVAVSSIKNTDSEVHVYMLQDGYWCKCTSAMTGIPCEKLQKPLLVDKKIYILTSLSGILILDLMTLSFSKIHLPEGVLYGRRFFTVNSPGLQCGGTTMLSRADDDFGVYLIHVNEVQLDIWLHKDDNWLLVDTICSREMSDGLKMSDCTLDDEHNDLVEITKVGPNAEFLLFKTRRCVLYWDVKCRKMRKVYEVTTDDYVLYDAHPFMMIWPTTFPALKNDTTM